MLLLLFVTVTASVFAQNSLKNFIHKYRKTENVTHIKIGRLLTFPMFSLTHLKIHFIEVLSFENSIQQKKNIPSEISNLQSNLIKDGYNEWLYVRSGDDRVNILGKMESDNIIKDCIFLVNDSEGETCIVRLKGNLDFRNINLNHIANLDISKWTSHINIKQPSLSLFSTIFSN